MCWLVGKTVGELVADEDGATAVEDVVLSDVSELRAAVVLSSVACGVEDKVVVGMLDDVGFEVSV